MIDFLTSPLAGELRDKMNAVRRRRAQWRNARAARWEWVMLAVVSLAGTGAWAQSRVNITLDPAQPAMRIPGDFVGLSFEMQTVLARTNGSHFFSPQNDRLINTFRILGIKSLRVGGNTADRPSLPTPDKNDVDALFGFAKAAGVKVIYTLRLNQGDPTADAQMAGYISHRYGKQLESFAIGNEPNVFSTNFATYLAEWKRYAAEITAPGHCPEARFSGPGVSPGHEKWSAQFARNIAPTGLLEFISQHDYPGGDARKVKDPAAARDKILSPAMEIHYAKFAANFVPAVLSSGLSYRFEEANSFYDGGAPDVSDTFAAALWALNYEWWWAEHGMRGINFHTGDKVAARDENKPCRYATFWTAADGYNIHPIGYAEKMFSLAGSGRIMGVEMNPPRGTNSDFAAYAVRDDSGNFSVTLINFNHGPGATSGAVQISARGVTGYRGAKVMRLESPEGDVAGKSRITLGSAGITDEAQWDGHWDELSPATARRRFPVAVDLPAASAAVVKFTAE